MADLMALLSFEMQPSPWARPPESTDTDHRRKKKWTAYLPLLCMHESPFLTPYKLTSYHASLVALVFILAPQPSVFIVIMAYYLQLSSSPTLFISLSLLRLCEPLRVSHQHSASKISTSNNRLFHPLHGIFVTHCHHCP